MARAKRAKKRKYSKRIVKSALKTKALVSEVTKRRVKIKLRHIKPVLSKGLGLRTNNKYVGKIRPGLYVYRKSLQQG